MCPELKQIFSRKSLPDFNLPKIFWEVPMLSAYCSARSPSLQSGKKTPRNNATCNRGIYYWLEPGPPALTKGVRRKGPEPQFSPVLSGYLLDTIISWRKWIGYTVGSWRKRIGYTVGSWRKWIGYTVGSWCKWIGYTVGSWCKWIGYTVGSWCKWIGYTVARKFLLAQRGAFSFPLIGSLFSC